ncbi:Rho-related BTB domain-containing protein 2, partial [Stegodyphus mimosarum]
MNAFYDIKPRGMSWSNVDDYSTRQEIIKCVVVGDTAVGKTRLICARACNAFLTLPQMLATHIPTVWAIDQYRNHEVLQRSWMIVDGVNVSLRLWDTFGDHEKDRKFAYGRSDVVLLCFSISSLQSLKNCKTKWYSEIKHNCPHAPIVLVGCKNDLRHMYRDEHFLELCRERSPFVRLIQENDMVSRDQGRQVANEIGAVYYETSVFTQYGVDEVFENAMRMALIARRQQRFWMKSLKNVRMPLLQIPYCPPEPKEPTANISESTFERELHSLLDKEYESDVILITRQNELKAHKIILAASSSYFKQIFISLSEPDLKKGKKVTLTTFQNFSSHSILSFLRFVYCDNLNTISYNEIDELKEIANITDVEEFQTFLRALEENDNRKKLESQKLHIQKMSSNLEKLGLQEQRFADVTFKVDNGKCIAHRSLLMARCDVMAAMFGGDFRESSAEIIPFPEVSKEAFDQCLYYLYTDCIEQNINVQNCLLILELANRLCLRRFISLIEVHIIKELSGMKTGGVNLTDYVFRFLETSQVHNADQLSEWCQYYIITHYQSIFMNDPKLLRSLHPDNQAYLNKNRWPPIHYLKEQEYYERCTRERELKERPQKYLLWKTTKKKMSQCLWSLNKTKETTENSEQSNNLVIHSVSN